MRYEARPLLVVVSWLYARPGTSGEEIALPSIQQAKQDLGVCGFHEVRIESAGESTHPIVLLSVAGDGDKPGLGGSRVRPDCSSDRIAVHSGKSDVTDNNIGMSTMGGRNAFNSSVGESHLITLCGQEHAQAFRRIAIIFHHKHADMSGRARRVGLRFRESHGFALKRQSDREFSPLLGARAMGTDGAVMKFHQPFNQCKSQAKSTPSTAETAIGLREWLEQARQKLRIDTDSCVPNLQDCLLPGEIGGDFDRSGRRIA